MPIYGYKCQNCSSDFESLESFTPTEPTKCPQCGSQSCQREAYSKKAPTAEVRGASAANNYGLKRGGKPSRRGL
jgi:putative FmdB family regulatory protein